jgi:hypothetical protein
MSSTTAVPQIPWPMATQAPSGEPIATVATPVPKASSSTTSSAWFVWRPGERSNIQARAADMNGRGMLEQLFLHRVLVEPRDGAQAAGDGRPRAAAGFQVAGEAFDVGAAHLEQAQVVLLAPGRVLAQVQRIRLAGQAGVTGQEPGQGQAF